MLHCPRDELPSNASIDSVTVDVQPLGAALGVLDRTHIRSCWAAGPGFSCLSWRGTSGRYVRRPVAAFRTASANTVGVAKSNQDSWRIAGSPLCARPRWPREAFAVTYPALSSRKTHDEPSGVSSAKNEGPPLACAPMSRPVGCPSANTTVR